jgi:hypothetical protein
VLTIRTIYTLLWNEEPISIGSWFCFKEVGESKHLEGKFSDNGEFNTHANLSELLVNHKSEKTQLCSTSVVELDGMLGNFGLLIKGVPPSKVSQGIRYGSH